MNRNPAVPDAEVMIATGCAHCPAVLAGLVELTKQGLLGRLEVVNVQLHPEAAASRNARSVPWTRIGPFVLEGLYSVEQLRSWARLAASGEGMSDYLSELLQNQKIEQALKMIHDSSTLLDNLVELAADLETPMGVRIGVGALFEELAGEARLAPALPGLLDMTRSEAPQLRADGAYYIGLIGRDVAEAHLRPLLEDENHEVREIAADALAPSDPTGP